MPLKDKEAKRAYQREWTRKKRETDSEWVARRNAANRASQQKNAAKHALSRQRSRKKNRAYVKTNTANYKAHNPEKFTATHKVREAVRLGKIIKPTECLRCGVKCNPDGHHPDYSKPLEVIWLCRRCHCEEHGKTLWIS